MRHQKSTRQALPGKPHRARMMARNLVTSVLLYESIRTTRTRARVIQPMIDRLIARAKTSNPRNAIRMLNAVVTDPNASKKVMEVFIQRYASRPSGFTRMKPAGSRKGDGAELVDLSLVDTDIGPRTSDLGTSTVRKPKSEVPVRPRPVGRSPTSAS